jgi:hypothetical protein
MHKALLATLSGVRLAAGQKNSVSA